MNEKGDYKGDGMQKVLIVVDMQKDFITGPLGTPEARAIVPKVRQKIDEYEANDNLVIFTKDTHYRNTYADTHEGRWLPTEHCIKDSEGWEIIPELKLLQRQILLKNTFGAEWRFINFNGGQFHLADYDSIELVGVCTDICVVSNALILRSTYPEMDITVDASCCAGTTPENHKAALAVMQSCHIEVTNDN